MPDDVSKFIRALAKICEEKELKAAVSESVKGGLLTGASAIVGGLLLGPLGLALGGAVGGTVAAISSNEKFKPVAQIILEMPYEKKQLLYNKIQRAFSGFGYQDVIGLTMVIMSSTRLKEIAIKEVVNFLAKDMSMSIQS